MTPEQCYKYHRAGAYDPIAQDPGSIDAYAARWVPPGSRILEVGCATGYLGRYLMRANEARIVGVEIDPGAAKAASEWYDRVIVGSIEREEVLAQLQGPFDVILLLSVLEHLQEPGAALVHLRPLLGDDGVLLVSLPNVAHWSIRMRLLAGRFDYEEYGIMDRTHLRLFTLRTARSLLLESGYTIDAFTIGDPGRPGVLRFLRCLRPWAARTLLRVYHSLPGLFGYQFLFKASKGTAQS